MLVISGCSSESETVTSQVDSELVIGQELGYVEVTSCDRLSEISEISSYFLVDFVEGSGPSEDELSELASWDTATITDNRNKLNRLFEEIQNDSEASDIHDAAETMQPLIVGLLDLAVIAPKEDPEKYLDLMNSYALSSNDQLNPELVKVVESVTALENYQENQCSGIQ